MAALREREEGNRRFRQEGSGSCIHSLQPRRDEREQAAQMQGAGRRRDRDEDQDGQKGLRKQARCDIKWRQWYLSKT